MRSILLVLTFFLYATASAKLGWDRFPAIGKDEVDEALGPSERDEVGEGGEEEEEGNLAEALAGLDFDGGRVRVTSPLPAEVPLARTTAEVTALVKAGRRPEAVAVAARGVRAWPSDPAAYESLAEALLSRLRYVEAEAALRTTLALAPWHAGAQARLAAVLDAQGRRDEALAAWRRTVELAPGNGLAHLRLAATAFLAGDRDTATRHLAIARRLGTTELSQLEERLRGEPATAVAGPRAILPHAAPPVRVDVGGGTAQSAEPIIATGDGQQLVAGWNDLRAACANGCWRVGAAVSLDGGAHWTDTIVRPPGALADDFEGDPMVVHDPRTGTQWVGGILFGYPNQRPSKIYLARRQTGGTGFATAIVLNTADFVDKGLTAVGHRPDLPNTTRLYVAYNLGLQTSDDLGATWTAVKSLGGGLGLFPRVGPNGEAYVVDWDFSFTNRIQRSFDGGATFGAPITVATRLATWGNAESPLVPGLFRLAPLPYFAVDPNDGTLYVIYTDASGTSGNETNLDLYFTRSTNQGATWTTPRVIHGDSTPPRDQFHPWLEVDSQGRLHLIFFDTRNTTQLDADTNARLDVYYATSTDHGDTWSEMRVTPQPFETRFATWPGFDQFVGDYVGLTTAGDRVFLVYPSTVSGNLDIYSQVLDFDGIFADGFETGNTAAWSSVVVP